MMKIIILSVLCLCSVLNGEIIISNQPKTNFLLPKEDFIIPWQADGNTEINQNLRSPLNAYTSLTHTYKRVDSISILPWECYGISELYTLSFYEDMDLEIENALDASWYRIRFKTYEITPIELERVPEPSTILFFVLFIPLLKNQNSELPRR